MKRIIALLLCAVMMGLALVSCGGPVDPVETNPTETNAPATEAPATEAPATEAPATEAPATEAPATEAPATEAPATEAPATEAPNTEAPNTDTPVNTAAYDRVILIGVDGAGAFFKNANTPNLDKIFADGAVTYTCQASTPSISAQCWGSMLHGVTPEYHRLSNSIVENVKFAINSPYPSSFRVLREADADAVLASFSHWNPINIGIIEDNLGVHKDTAGSDAELTQKIVAYLETNAPNYMFVQFDDADGSGHSNGYGSANHLETISEIDGYIGQIYNKLEEKGLLENTLFLVTADHGGTPGGSHGGDSYEEMNVMFAAAGKTVVAGGEPQKMQMRDIAGVVLHAFGLEQPDMWTALVPSDLFEGVVAGKRPQPKMEDMEAHRTHESVPTPTVDSGNYITDYISADRIFAYLPLDGDSLDVVYDSYTSESGKIYYVDGFYGKASQLDDGCIEIEEFIPLGKSFSMGFWINASNMPLNDPCIVSNKRWENGKNPGFVLSLVTNSARFNVGNGSDRMDYDFALPMDFYTGWTYMVLSIDLEAKTVGLSIDFEEFVTVEISDPLKGCLFVGVPGLVIGQDGSKAYGEALPATVDEFLLIEGVLTQEDVSALATYYGIEK